MNTALAVLNAVFILFFLYPDLLNPKKRKLRSQYLVSRWNYSKALGVKSENAIRAVSDTRYLPSLLKKKKREGRTYEAKPPTAIRKKTLKLGMFLAFSFFIFV